MRFAGTSRLSVLLACACAVAGCGPRYGPFEVSPGEVPSDLRLPAASTVVQVYSPARIAVYPLSRFEGSGDARRAVIDVRVLDAYGHDVKWPGVLRVETSLTESFAQPDVRWIDLTEGEVNARFFDAISGCYAVRIPAPGNGPLNVRVRWLQATGDGRVLALEAEGVLSPGN